MNVLPVERSTITTVRSLALSNLPWVWQQIQWFSGAHVLPPGEVPVQLPQLPSAFPMSHVRHHPRPRATSHLDVRGNHPVRPGSTLTDIGRPASSGPVPVVSTPSVLTTSRLVHGSTRLPNAGCCELEANSNRASNALNVC